ncbi:MAG: GNAT family N-acetyltransferase [Rhodothermales bacterium]
MIRIRPARLEDVPLLERIIPESVRSLSVGFYSPVQIDLALAHMFGVDTQLIEDGTYYVAEVDGRVVGCGGWSRRRTLFGGDHWKSEVDTLLDASREAAKIRAFFVHPDWARKGIGRRIIELSEESARMEGFGKLELVATLPGETLYAALGYSVVERILISLGMDEGLPAVHMEKPLPVRK